MPDKLIVIDEIAPLILTVRNKHVLLDRDWATLYGTTTKALNQAVKRNRDRFPGDFMFQLTAAEKAELVTQCDHLASLKFSRTLPYAFTEHGTIMAASVLNTPRAVEVNVFVIRAFVKLRQVIVQHYELSKKLAELERKLGGHDEAIRQFVAAIRELMKPAQTPVKRGRIGFARKNDE